MLNELEALNTPVNENWTLDNVNEFSSEVFVGTLLLKAETLEPISLDPEVFKYKADIWWLKWKHTFQKWWEVIEKKYEPLWDREGWEDIIDKTQDYGVTGQTTKNKEVVDDDTTKKSTTDETINSTETGTWNETHEDEVTSDSLTENTTNKVSAFDQANNYSPHDTSDHTSSHTSGNDGTSSGGDSRTRNTTDKTTYDETGTDDRTTNFDGQIDGSHTNTNDYTHTLHSWGNWGISQTVQKLKEQELKVQYWNLYDKMADIFCREMLVRVYL